jgi:formate dehydrogenase subunit gamma
MMRYIQRHSPLARSVHWAHMLSTILLFLTGLVLFIPSIGAAFSVDTIQIMRIVHRVSAVVFIVAPIASMALSPSGTKRFFGQMTRSWSAEDKEFMRKFPMYLFRPKSVHMPKQPELKSGQVAADWVMIVFAVLIALSGAFMWAQQYFSAELIRWVYLLHDVSMIMLGVIVLAHAYLGLGLFKPYRGAVSWMLGDGKVSETDARYHWGDWAEEEIRSGKNVTTE